MVEKNKEIVINYIPKNIKEDNKESEDNNEKKIRIFGQDFVYNNIYKCKIIYNNEEYELDEYINNIDEDYNNKDEFTLKLRGINNVTDMSSMFEGCESLSSLPDISNWNTSNVTDISYMFEGCESLSSLPDISNWNTSNVTDISICLKDVNHYHLYLIYQIVILLILLI